MEAFKGLSVKMKKLEDIPKKQVFTVPDDYFNKLPGTIQARISAGRRTEGYTFRYALRYAVPVVVLLIAAIFWLNRFQDDMNDTESILASIHTADLVSFLDESGITTEELLDHVSLETNEVEAIEGTVYGLDLGEEEIEELIEGI